MGKMNFYYGITHTHTEFSNGKGTPNEACDYARKKGIDFLCITDHFDKLTEKEGQKWIETKKQVDKINRLYLDFVGIRGLELPISSYGHIGIINNRKLPTCVKKMAISDFINFMEGEYDAVSCLNHPDKGSYGVCTQINLCEVGNGSKPNKYKRYEKLYYEMLDKGFHMGAVNGQDNHRRNWGDEGNLTAIVAERLSVEDIIDAMKQRRTYSTESKTLTLKFKGNNEWMGKVLNIEEGANIEFLIEVEDRKRTIKTVQLISNGGKIIREFSCDKNKMNRFKINQALKVKGSWYLIRVIEKDDICAVSSPIFTA